MKVSELIEQLSKLPQDLEILLECGDPDLATFVDSAVLCPNEHDDRRIINDDEERVPFVLIQFGMESREIVTD